MSKWLSCNQRIENFTLELNDCANRLEAVETEIKKSQNELKEAKEGNLSKKLKDHKMKLASEDLKRWRDEKQKHEKRMNARRDDIRKEEKVVKVILEELSQHQTRMKTLRDQAFIEAESIDALLGVLFFMVKGT